MKGWLVSAGFVAVATYIAYPVGYVGPCREGMWLWPWQACSIGRMVPPPPPHDRIGETQAAKDKAA